MTTLEAPLLIINCKHYGDTGALASAIARAAVDVQAERRAAGKPKVTVAVAVPATEIHRTASLGLIPILAEHLDGKGLGATTGSVIAEDILRNGGVGSLINHSEDPYESTALTEAVSKARTHGLTSVVCAKDASKAHEYAKLKPDYIAMEPPELIGGDVSVSTANPGLITDTIVSVRMVADIPVLVGAGVKNSGDVKKAVELGAAGVLVASGVTKAADHRRAIAELAKGFD